MNNWMILALSQILVPLRDGDFLCLPESGVPRQSTISAFSCHFLPNPLLTPPR